MILLITACSKKKSVVPTASAARLGKGTPIEIAQTWCEWVAQADKRLEADCLYAGRSHRIASAAAKRVGADHLIMSAGLGLIRSTDQVPPYALTVRRGEVDSILPHFNAGASAVDWWAAIEGASPWARPFPLDSAPILVALPLSYLSMFELAFERLPPDVRARVRFISGGCSDALPNTMRAQLLPYDDRLNGPDSPHRGTQSDFLGRAVQHALPILAEHHLAGVESHCKLIDGALAAMRPPTRRRGENMADDAITSIIVDAIGSFGEGSASLLRHLRRDLGIACEERRFRRLYAYVLSGASAA